MSSMFPEYNTQLFTDIYGEVNDFVYDYNNCGFPRLIQAESVATLYYLLYARFGNSPIANMDVNQFKYKVFGIIWQYGPSWEKRLDIQAKLRAITDTDLLKGAEAIYNHAYNPETVPSTDARTPLTYINDQNVTLYNKSKMDAYTQLWDLLATDVTEEFISRFNPLFNRFVKPVKHPLYVTEEDDE